MRHDAPSCRELDESAKRKQRGVYHEPTRGMSRAPRVPRKLKALICPPSSGRAEDRANRKKKAHDPAVAQPLRLGPIGETDGVKFLKARERCEAGFGSPHQTFISFDKLMVAFVKSLKAQDDQRAQKTRDYCKRSQVCLYDV